MAKTIVQPRKTNKRPAKTSAVKTTTRAASRTRHATTPVYDQHIVVVQGIRGGKPRIAGRRIAVEDIVAMHLFHGQSIEYIINNYKLSPVKVYAALTYYYDHRAEIDRSLADGVLQYEKDKANNISLVEQKQSQAASSAS